MELTKNSQTDLELSGLTAQDINARPITAAEFAACGAQSGSSPDGYVIPYFDLQGRILPYYRIKVNDLQARAKYLAMKEQPNHVYFPPMLMSLLKRGGHNFIIITEGEKKAACAVKKGFPAVALAGVDSWRNRRILLPDNTQFTPLKGRGMVRAKIPSGDSNDLVSQDTGVLAKGFVELVDFLVVNRLEAVIIFDTDKGGVGTEVQRAAAQLGYEIRYRGLPISSIRQLVLPPAKDGSKIGLDDYLMRAGTKEFAARIRACRAKRIAFPRHPNPKTYVATRMQKTRMSRKETQDVSLSILMELETRGRRLRNTSTQNMHWFDERTHTLMPVHLASNRILLHDTAFGAYLYREFNLSGTDTRVVGWLAAQFHGEPGAEDTITHRVFAIPEDMQDCIAYQLSDSHFIIVTPNPSEPYLICENGEHGVLFEQNSVARIDHHMFEGTMEEWLAHKGPIWKDVLKTFNLAPTMPAGKETSLTDAELTRQGRLLSMLIYYISPWLLRWKGIQLPIELTIGEPGSGKSSMYELRQTILTGAPRLSNMTMDIKDWYAGITSSGGLYVLDNVHFTGASKDYRQRLSDELCRLVTEPDPHIEMRKLYTNADVISLPVNCTFALTAIEQPFYTTDLIQRSAIFELQVISKGHDANWVTHQVEKCGDRSGWVAHQLVMVHRFLRLAHSRWDDSYRASHRLKHYEQALVLMAEVCGIESDWIPQALKRVTATKITETDWVMNGLSDFVQHFKDNVEDHTMSVFGVSDVIEWAEGHQQHHKNKTLTNPWSLGKYIKGHTGLLLKTLGVFENGRKNNRAVYSVKEV